MRACIKAASGLTCALTVALAGACSDEEIPAAPSTRENPALTSGPLASLDSLGEMQPFIEIAREVPSFGGFWFNDQDQIVVALTNPADFQRVVAMIPEHLGAHQPSNGYTAMLVARPFADLARFRASLRAEVFGLAGVVSLGVKESANRVEVGVTDLGVEPVVRALVRTLGIPDEAVAVLRVPMPQVISHALDNQHPSGAIEGGWEIGSPRGPTTAATCTLGFAAFRNDGSPVFVTNYHCTPTSPGFDGGPITQPAFGGHAGSEILDPDGSQCISSKPWIRCRNADAALFSAARPLQFAKIARPTGRTTADVSGGPLTIDHANPTFTISSSNFNVFQEEWLEKVGKTTGWSHGKVEDTCNDYISEGSMRLCSHRVDFAVQDGDSGSPVFYLRSDGTADLRGIVFGWQKWPYSDGLMSGLGQIVSDLGPLRVHIVQAHISGPTSVPPGQTRTWTGSAFGGKPPFTYAWYRAGALVSTSSSYTGTVGPYQSSFELRLDISDALGDTASDTHPVSSGYSCGPPLGSC